MEAEFIVTNPNIIELEAKIKMKLSDWRELSKEIEVSPKSGHYLCGQLLSLINEMVIKAESHFYPE